MLGFNSLLVPNLNRDSLLGRKSTDFKTLTGSSLNSGLTGAGLNLKLQPQVESLDNMLANKVSYIPHMIEGRDRNSVDPMVGGVDLVNQ